MCQRNVRDRECAVLPEMESEETTQEVRGSDSLGRRAPTVPCTVTVGIISA
jgi:hypothetical protein